MDRIRSSWRERSPAWGVAAVLLVCVVCEAALGQPPQPFKKLFDTLWYLRSMAEIDDLTLVYGGVEGSSALIFRDYDNGKSYWTLLEGNELYLSDGSGSTNKWITTTVAGNFLTTERGATQTSGWSGPSEANKRQLSWAIVDLYARSKAADSANPILHAPFLKGFGWPGGGASFAEVQRICASMYLPPPELNTGSPTTGYVVSQTPEGGTLLTDPNTIIKVTLSGGIPTMPSNSGDWWDNPLIVGELGANGRVDATCPMTTSHVHREDPPSGLGGDANSVDAFFKLPASSRGRLVTVSQQAGAFDRLVLNAWKKSSTGALEYVKWDGNKDVGALGLKPVLVFVSPADADCYVMAEFKGRNLGSVRLTFQW
jgi:hypothetical protein